MVKDRAYDRDGTYAQAGQEQAVRSARVALNLAVDTFVRLFAPVLPYAAEEVWSWYRTGSVHRAQWPSIVPLAQAAGDADPATLHVAGQALAALRKVKSENKVSQRTAFLSATLSVPAADEAKIAAVRGDLLAAAHVTGEFTVVTDGTEGAHVTGYELAEPEPKKK